MANEGVSLEARVQRLFFAQGIFAERSLFPAADVNHRLLATDIDVLASEYSGGFHLTRRHAECKSGRRVAILDRLLWLNGVRNLLSADASYLVLESFDEDAADFARSLDIDVMTFKQLETWERGLDLPEGHWPNRSNYKIIDPAKAEWIKLGRPKVAAEPERIVRQAIQFVEIDSWQRFGYGRLNRLLRLLKILSDLPFESTDGEPRPVSVRYCASALLVRLCQYLLAVCHDVSRVPVSDLESYLTGRLVFGDQDPGRAQGLVDSTINWMSQTLKDQGIAIPPGVDSTRFFQSPQYTEGFVALIGKLLASPNQARYLPISMETDQFGEAEGTEMFPRLRSAWHAGRDLVALVRGFTVASLGVDNSILLPIGNNLIILQEVRNESAKSDGPASRGQRKFNWDR